MMRSIMTLTGCAVLVLAFMADEARAAYTRKFPAKGIETVRIGTASGSIRVEVKEKASGIEVIALDDDADDYGDDEGKDEGERKETAKQESGDDEWDRFFDRPSRKKRGKSRGGLRSDVRGNDLIVKHRSSSLKVVVPKGVNVTVKSQSGSIRIAGELGSIEAHSMSGSIALAVTSSSLEVKTLSGDLDIDAKAGVQEVISISGDVAVKGTAKELRVGSTSGDVVVQYMPTRLAAKTVSGEIRVKGDLPREAVHEFEAVSGDILLWITNDTGFEVKASSFDSDVWINGQHHDGGVRKKVGDGSGRIRVSTMNGEVRIKQEN